MSFVESTLVLFVRYVQMIILSNKLISGQMLHMIKSVVGYLSEQEYYCLVGQNDVIWSFVMPRYIPIKGDKKKLLVCT